MGHKKGVTQSEMAKAIDNIQELIKIENLQRVETSSDSDWDLVTQIIIREDSLILETESLIMKYENGFNGKAKIVKKPKKGRGDNRG
jgi:hypothetical protein